MIEYIIYIILGIIIGVIIDNLLFRIWHHFAHSKHLLEKEKIRKKEEAEEKVDRYYRETFEQ